MNKLNKTARIAEIGDTSKRILDYYEADAGVKKDPYLKTLFTEIQNLTDKITEAIRKDKALSELDDADAVRDSAISGIFKIVEGYAVMRIETLKTAGQHILQILENFRGIAKRNYTEESQLIEAMLKDLAPLSTDIQALVGLPEAVAFLRTAQDNFAAKRQLYEKSQTENKQTEVASAIKKPLTDVINLKLKPYLEAMKMANAQQYGTFADQVATAIETTNTAVDSRSAKKKDDTKAV